MNSINEHRSKLGLSWDEIRSISRNKLKERIRKYDTSIWLEGLQKKISLRWYIQGKQRIAYENCYRNNRHSAFLAKARTNSLQLEDQLGRGKPNYDKTCKLCQDGKEDLDHFMVKCEKLESERDRRIIEDTDKPIQERTVEILFKSKSNQKTAIMIKKMWDLRKRLRDDLRPP